MPTTIKGFKTVNGKMDEETQAKIREHLPIKEADPNVAEVIKEEDQGIIAGLKKVIKHKK